MIFGSTLQHDENQNDAQRFGIMIDNPAKTTSPEERPSTGKLSPPPSPGRARRWLLRFPRAVPLVIFIAIAAVTAFSVYAIESNERAREEAQMREAALSIASALERRGTSFATYLRAGAALFSTTEDVSLPTFRQFVSELRLDLEYRGAEGIGWVTALEPEAVDGFLEIARTEQSMFPAIRPAYSAGAQTVAPVTYFFPENARNQRALGFDMYSEPVRAAAMDEAKRTVQPTASGRLVLAQEGKSNAPGFIVFMPVYRQAAVGRGDKRSLAGFVYSPFNVGELLDSAIVGSMSEDMGVRLYDGEAAVANLLVSNSLAEGGGSQVEQQVNFANRELRLVVQAPHGTGFALLSMVTLFFGLAVASLLMLLARMLTRQALEDQRRLTFFEEQHSIRNSLTRELNHRVKNTLANVLSILSLTRRRAESLDAFADGLEGRIRSLSATHDLLTGTDWSTTPIRSVVEAELSHFREATDHVVNIDGPAVELAPNDALSFGLAIHELATNAAKFGAFSVPQGRVSVYWRLVDEQHAEVEWTESEGPEVPQERSRGFGTELIEKIVAHELKNPVQLSFLREGVRCVMRVPVRKRNGFKIRQSD